jgi:hypothetical protein
MFVSLFSSRGPCSSGSSERTVNDWLMEVPKLPQLCGTCCAMMTQTCIVIWVDTLFHKISDIEEWYCTHGDMLDTVSGGIMALPCQSKLQTWKSPSSLRKQMFHMNYSKRRRCFSIVRMATTSSFWKMHVSKIMSRDILCHLQKAVLCKSFLGSLWIPFGTGVSDHTSALQINALVITCLSRLKAHSKKCRFQFVEKVKETQK